MIARLENDPLVVVTDSKKALFMVNLTDGDNLNVDVVRGRGREPD